MLLPVGWSTFARCSIYVCIVRRPLSGASVSAPCVHAGRHSFARVAVLCVHARSGASASCMHAVRHLRPCACSVRARVNWTHDPRARAPCQRIPPRMPPCHHAGCDAGRPPHRLLCRFHKPLRDVVDDKLPAQATAQTLSAIDRCATWLASGAAALPLSRKPSPGPCRPLHLCACVR